MIDVTEGRMPGRQSLITWSGILSIPGDLFGAIDLIIFCTSSTFTLSLKKNCSETGYSRGTKVKSCSSHRNCSAKVLMF